MDIEEIKKLREKLEDYQPILPEALIEYFMEKNGVQINDESCKKLISAMAHKFLIDLANNAFQFHKISTKAASKDKRFAKEKKPTLSLDDLEKAFEEMGIDISRPHYLS